MLSDRDLDEKDYNMIKPNCGVLSLFLFSSGQNTEQNKTNMNEVEVFVIMLQYEKLNNLPIMEES